MDSTQKINFIELKSLDAMKYFTEIANLRIQVFHEFPYLYEGTLKYEEQYLKSSFKKAESYVCLILDEDKVIGASTAFAMRDQKNEFKKPLQEAGVDVSQVCYFGESVLMKEYRGLGLGHKLMDFRLNFAKEHRFESVYFAAVVRPDNHPLKPAHYRSNDAFWLKRGFIKTDIYCEFSWQDIDEKHETIKKLRYWYQKI